MYDVDRLEVLEGPQGTLYGKNTAGGAINIISKRPSDHAKYPSLRNVVRLQSCGFARKQ